MGRKAKKELVNAVPDKILKRADAIQYWLQQRDLPKENSDTWRERLTMMDKVVINLIRSAMGESDGKPNASVFNYLMENGFGKNTESRDLTVSGENNAGARFNIPKTVSELKQEKENDGNTI